MHHQNEFEHLFRSHYEDCIKFAYSLMKSIVDAEEIVQDVFLKLWEKKDTISIETSPKGYLLIAIRNKAYEYFRKKVKAPTIVSEEYTFSNNAYINDFHLENKQLETMLKKAIDGLPDKCREVFLLSRHQQFTYKQISEHLDISVKTVENHIGKALKILHSSIEHLLTIVIFFHVIGVTTKFFI